MQRSRNPNNLECVMNLLRSMRLIFLVTTFRKAFLWQNKRKRYTFNVFIEIYLLQVGGCGVWY